MAPEQLAGTEVTVRSDIYALGLVLVRNVHGQARVRSQQLMAEMTRLREETAPPSLVSHVRDLDPAVERVVRRCLDNDPQNRPQSALAVAAGLPGGDPLAAALAAGETPSPELVARGDGPRGAAAAGRSGVRVGDCGVPGGDSIPGIPDGMDFEDAFRKFAGSVWLKKLAIWCGLSDIRKSPSIAPMGCTTPPTTCGIVIPEEGQVPQYVGSPEHRATGADPFLVSHQPALHAGRRIRKRWRCDFRRSRHGRERNGGGGRWTRRDIWYRSPRCRRRWTNRLHPPSRWMGKACLRPPDLIQRASKPPSRTGLR